MNGLEIREQISEKSGVPVDLLTGDTLEENVAQAKALLAYKRECENIQGNSESGTNQITRPQTTKEQFANWLNQKSKCDPFKNSWF